MLVISASGSPWLQPYAFGGVGLIPIEVNPRMNRFLREA